MSGRRKTHQIKKPTNNGCRDTMRGHIAIKSSPQLRQDLSGFEMIFSVFTLVLATVAAVPDCYLPFLSATTACKSASDCNGAACVYSLNRLQRVCCEPKEGAVQPVCSVGKPAALPILCDPNSKEIDVCPDDYECRESVTNFEKINGEPNYLCCR